VGQPLQRQPFWLHAAEMMMAAVAAMAAEAAGGRRLL
jgi:hypothetical protein